MKIKWRQMGLENRWRGESYLRWPGLPKASAIRRKGEPLFQRVDWLIREAGDDWVLEGGVYTSALLTNAVSVAKNRWTLMRRADKVATLLGHRATWKDKS